MTSHHAALLVDTYGEEALRWEADDTPEGIRVASRIRLPSAPDDAEDEDPVADYEPADSLLIPWEVLGELVEMYALRHPERFQRGLARMERWKDSQERRGP